MQLSAKSRIKSEEGINMQACKTLVHETNHRRTQAQILVFECYTLITGAPMEDINRQNWKVYFISLLNG